MTTDTEQIHIENLHLEDAEPLAVTFEPFNLPASNQRLLGSPHPPDTVNPLALRLAEKEGSASLDTIVDTIKDL